MAEARGTLIRRALRHVPVLLLGRPLHGRERYQPFFIVGSGRCGTTLLRAMLEGHPDVHIPPENYILPFAVRAYRRYSRLPWSVLLRVVLAHFEFQPEWEAFELSLRPLFHELAASPPASRNLAAVLNALHRAHAQRHKPAAIRWGDKTPSNALALPELRAVFPDLRVVHMVRDGRDVVASFLRFPDCTPLRAAGQWLRSVEAAQAFGARHTAQYLEIRYEALIAEPRAILEQVAAFLGIGFDERMLHHHALELPIGDVDRQPHLQGVRQPVYNTAVGRWRKDLNAAQIVEVERLIGPTLARLGYLPAGARYWSQGGGA